jgi:hypothetical protein
MRGVHIDPWTKPSDFVSSLGGPQRGERRERVGVRKYSYQPPRGGGLWGDDGKERRKLNKLSSKEEWKQWGDLVEDPLSLDARDYSSRPLKRGKKPSAKYALEHQYPTYSQFGIPQLADPLGRQYKWADGLDAAELQRVGRIETVGNPFPSDNVDNKSAYLYVRFPIGARSGGVVDFPEAEGDVTLMALDTRTIYQGRVEWVEGDDKNKKSATGAVFLRNMKPMGTASTEFSQRILGTLPKKYQRKFS